MKNTFIHHVYFWLKNPDKVPDKAELINGLYRLSTISTIRNFHIGESANTDRNVIDNSYAISWLVVFNTAADQESYQAGPIHLQFIDACSDLWSKVVVDDTVDAVVPFD
jgi:hypothetical protein